MTVQQSAEGKLSWRRRPRPRLLGGGVAIFVPGAFGLVTMITGIASLIDATTSTHLASVDRPRGAAAVWGVIGVIAGIVLVTWTVLYLCRPVEPRGAGS